MDKLIETMQVMQQELNSIHQRFNIHNTPSIIQTTIADPKPDQDIEITPPDPAPSTTTTTNGSQPTQHPPYCT